MSDSVVILLPPNEPSTARRHTTIAALRATVQQPEWLSNEAAAEFERLYDEACEEISQIVERYTLRPLVEDEQQQQHHLSPPARMPRAFTCWWLLMRRLFTNCLVVQQHACPLDVEAARIANASFRAGTLVMHRAANWADACFRCIKTHEMNATETRELETYLDERVDATVKTVTTHFQNCYKSYCQATEKTTQ